MINFINAFIYEISIIVIGVLGLLPDTPFNWELGALGEYWSYVTYFIPFAEMVTVLTAYVTGVAIWYVLRWVLRFVRYIQ